MHELTDAERRKLEAKAEENSDLGRVLTAFLETEDNND